MPDRMEANLIRVLDGLSLDDLPCLNLCDFTLDEQNAASEAQGVKPSAVDYRPALGKSVTYIVGVVLINDRNEVLMIQEAKETCAGKWYLPIGRMERGESIVEAGVREVYEETGLNVQLTTLLAVESAGGSWMRFVLTGHITGGELKTPARADQESIQAKWVLNMSELSLRAHDILRIIEIGRLYHARTSGDGAWHTELLPSLTSHARNYLRVVIAIKKRTNNRVHILLSEKNAYHFPTVEIHPSRSLHSTLRKFMVELFGADLPQHRPHGLLSVEHSPGVDGSSAETMDGVCLTLLVTMRPPIEEVSLIGKCTWWSPQAKEVENRLLTVIGSKNSTISFNVIR